MATQVEPLLPGGRSAFAGQRARCERGLVRKKLLPVPEGKGKPGAKDKGHQLGGRQMAEPGNLGRPLLEGTGPLELESLWPLQLPLTNGQAGSDGGGRWRAGSRWRSCQSRCLAPRLRGSTLPAFAPAQGQQIDGQKNIFTVWPDEDSEYEINNWDVNKILIVTQMPPYMHRHTGGDLMGNHTSHAKMSAELAEVINDGLFYYEQDLWTKKFEPEYSQIKQEVENFKKVNMISWEQFDTLTPEPPVDPNQEVPPGPPNFQQVPTDARANKLFGAPEPFTIIH
ncbi:La-related protein 1 [Heterocephalus glaber]|uniref:La-related protein 1 n=1 Tax=Heterocephalus glaber TaxID=10181 RepID=G5C7N8_HETGA|nr:La-related protein 1 [Heterocephalus glaber]